MERPETQLPGQNDLHGADRLSARGRLSNESGVDRVQA